MKHALATAVRMVALAAAGATGASAQDAAAPEVMAARLLKIPGFERGYRAGIDDSRSRMRERFDFGDSPICAAAREVEAEHRRDLDALLDRAIGREAFEGAFARTFAALPADQRSRMAAVLASEEFAQWFAGAGKQSSFLGRFGEALSAADRRERWRQSGQLDDMIATGQALKDGLALLASEANAALKREAVPLYERNHPRVLAAIDACLAPERAPRDRN